MKNPQVPVLSSTDFLHARPIKDKAHTKKEKKKTDKTKQLQWWSKFHQFDAGNTVR